MVLKNMDFDISPPIPDPKNCWAQVALYVISSITKRTSLGKDVENTAFHAYSDKYGKLKKSNGGLSNVNLFSVPYKYKKTTTTKNKKGGIIKALKKGFNKLGMKSETHMMNDIVLKKYQKNGCEIGFQNDLSSKKAYWNENAEDWNANAHNRPFFALNDNDQEQIKKIVVKFIEL